MRDATADAGAGCLWVPWLGQGARTFSAIHSKSCAFAEENRCETRRSQATRFSSRRPLTERDNRHHSATIPVAQTRRPGFLFVGERSKRIVVNRIRSSLVAMRKG